MLNIKEAMKAREAKVEAAKKAPVTKTAKPAVVAKKPVVTTGYAESSMRSRKIEFSEKVDVGMPKFLEQARERTQNLHKQAANFLQRSDAAPKIEKAIREGDDVRARSLIMRSLQCDKETSTKVLAAYRLL